MEVKAVARYVRISPQKVRKMAGAIKGKPVEKALATIKFMPQKSAGIVEKILRSAIANADQIADLDIDDLIVGNVIVDNGPMFKRFRARARGRGTRILKRTSHVTVILTEATS
ncbi:MAG: 50S ribosomal protein L22 [Desulfatitalea sp.]|nr:50S ribosomal protein L22 [Desulfatitalea sp.]NNK01191.1 50S ribosomal protein L22 [Desulfatitalea sp.]